MISKIKYILEHNSCLKGMVPLCRKLGIVHIIHLLKGNFERIGNTDSRKEFKRFCENHKKDFERLSKLLEDEFSRETLQRILEFRMNWKMKTLSPVIVEPQYFQSDIFKCSQQEVMIDGGAYVGDTIEEFMKYLENQGGVYKNICLGA